jgi:hypothetical protein
MLKSENAIRGSFQVNFSLIAPDIGSQLRIQKLEISNADANRFEIIRKGITTLYGNDLITSLQRERICVKFLDMIGRNVKEISENLKVEGEVDEAN